MLKADESLIDPEMFYATSQFQFLQVKRLPFVGGLEGQYIPIHALAISDSPGTTAKDVYRIAGRALVSIHINP